MKWDLLIKNKCPRCSGDLGWKTDYSIGFCLSKCGFVITNDSYHRTVSKVISDRISKKSIKSGKNVKNWIKDNNFYLQDTLKNRDIHINEGKEVNNE